MREQEEIFFLAQAKRYRLSENSKNSLSLSVRVVA